MFHWGALEQASFNCLKCALSAALVLWLWDPARPTRLTTDASEVATSAVLEQLVDCSWHPIAFESGKLAPA